jgi:hypothetical protein
VLKRDGSFQRGVLGLGALIGIEPEQVVQLVPSGSGQAEQAALLQQVQRLRRLLGVHACQLSRDRRGQRRPGEQAEPAEHGLGQRRQLQVGQREARPDGEVADLKAGQPGFQGEQPVPQLPGRRGRAGGELRAGDAQCQRQPAADPDQLAGTGFAPVGTGRRRAGQQPGRVLLGERVKRDEPPGAQRQPGEPVPAGDQHQAGRPGRDQRPDLVLVHRVVQQQQAATVGQPGPVAGGELVGVRRQVRAEQPESPGEPSDDLPGGHRAFVRAAEVGEQLAVRILGTEQVRGVYGERGLAHARQPGNRPDRRRGAGRPRGCADAGQVRGPADEVPHIRGKLVRDRHRTQGELANESAPLLPPRRLVTAAGADVGEHECQRRLVPAVGGAGQGGHGEMGTAGQPSVGDATGV